jgi:hypothetical protein
MGSTKCQAERVALSDFINATLESHPVAPVERAIAAPPGLTLPLAITQQEMDLWCWAAVASGIALCLKPASGWSQCLVASDVCGASCCPRSEACNHTAELTTALKKVGHFGRIDTGRALFSDIRSQIDAGFPVAIRLLLTDPKAGHYVAISGYLVVPPRNVIIVEDPWDGSSLTTYYSEFPLNYHEPATWGNTYFTT